jgi:hypothetical protein
VGLAAAATLVSACCLAYYSALNYCSPTGTAKPGLTLLLAFLDAISYGLVVFVISLAGLWLLGRFKMRFRLQLTVLVLVIAAVAGFILGSTQMHGPPENCAL